MGIPSNKDRWNCTVIAPDGKARCLLVKLGMLCNGSNNRHIYLSVEDAKCRLGLGGHHTVTATLNELQELGYITKTADSHFHVKTSETSRARTRRPSRKAGPGRKGPSMDFLTEEAGPKTAARARVESSTRRRKKR